VTSDFLEVEKEMTYLDRNSLVIFDVDGTLIVPGDAVLKPAAKKVFKELIDHYETDRDLFREIRMQARHFLVDAKIPTFVQKLQKENIAVIAFTSSIARLKGSSSLPGLWRVEELKKHGLDFSRAFPDVSFLELSRKEGEEQPALFRSGVLYSSFHSKGGVLIEFLKQLNFRPSKVVIVDDEMSYVLSVVECLKKEGIACAGIHYTAAEEASSKPDLDLSSFQIEYFMKGGIWLSDSLAKTMLTLRINPALETYK
jgi:hypothetical protein